MAYNFFHLNSFLQGKKRMLQGAQSITLSVLCCMGLIQNWIAESWNDLDWKGH